MPRATDPREATEQHFHSKNAGFRRGGSTRGGSVPGLSSRPGMSEATVIAPAPAPVRALGKRGSFVPNILANGFNFGISLLIGFWFTPYLIGKLGIAVYGLIPLATTLTRYMSILTAALDSSVGRFLTVALERRDYAEANRIFNSAFFGTAGICVLLVVPFVALSFFADRLLNVPAGYETQVRILVAFAAASFLIDALRAPFRASCFALNRFDIQNVVEIAYQIARVAIVIAIFAILLPKVWHVGAAMTAAAFLALIASVTAWRALTPILHISPRALQGDTLKRVGNTSGWVLASNLGIILSFSVDLLVVNLLLGAEAAGHYAVVWQWSTLIRGLAMTLSGVFSPTIMGYHAKGDVDALVLYARRAIKFVGLGLALPAGLISGLAAPLLLVWLGPEFTGLSPLMVLLIAHLAVNMAFIPLASVFLAADRVRLPAMINFAMGAITLVSALLLAGPAGWGVYGVGAAGVITLTLRNLCFTPQYAARVVGKSGGTFLTVVPVLLTGLAFSGGLGWLVAENFALRGWFDLGLAAGAISLLYCAFSCLVLLTSAERALIQAMVRGILRKFV